MAWNFQREEQSFALLAEGNYRIRIKSAEKAVSKSGNDMLALQFEVSGSNKVLYHYITFMESNPQLTNRLLTGFFDAFKDIKDGDFNLAGWIGKVGACHVKHEEDNGYGERERISYFIKADKQASLPAWEEPSNGGNSGSGNGFISMPVDTEDVPF